MESLSGLIALVGNNFGWIASLTALWWFRKPLTGVLERARTLKGAVGGASVTVETGHAPEPVTASTPAPAATPSPEALEDASKKPEALEDKSEDADVSRWFSEMFQALEDRQVDKARSAFEKLQAAEKEEDKRFWNEAFFRHRFYRLTGERSEIDRLESMAKEAKSDEQRRAANTWLYWTFTEIGDTKRAIQLMRSAVATEHNEAQKTQWIVNLSGALRNDRQVTDALTLLEDRLAAVTTDDERASLFGALHRLEKEREDNLAAAVALEKALEFNPGEHQRLFDAAFAESDAGLQLLSLQNYNTLVNLNSKHPSALNNFGVTAGRLEVKGHEVAYFRRAVDEMEDSLAMANLAFKYLGVGCFDDARALLDKARKLPNPAPQVGQALAALEKQKAEDDEKWAELSRKATEFQREARLFGAALFDRPQAAKPFAGTWSLDGQEFIVEETGGRISADWAVNTPIGLALLASGAGLSRARAHSTDKLTIRGTRRNGAAMVTYHRKRVEPPPTFLGGVDESVGCLSYMSQDGAEWHIFSNEPDKKLKLIARRVVTLPT